MVKFPGGTPGRWEKIAHELGRSLSEVSLTELNEFKLNRTAEHGVLLSRFDLILGLWSRRTGLKVHKTHEEKFQSHRPHFTSQTV